MPTRVVACIVCTVESEEAVMAVCFRCGDWYHLNPYATRPGLDCGIAALGNEETGIDYYCFTCIAEIRSETAAEQRRQNIADNGAAAPLAAMPAPPPPAATPPRRRFRRVEP